jgi:integrase
MLVGDIDLDQHIIRVPLLRAKNTTTEIVTIPIQFEEACLVYGIPGADKSLYVFGKKRCPSMIPWSDNMLRYQFNVIRDDLGLSKDYKFYSLKHTGATMLHNSGMPIRAEMDQLRHKRLSATQHYLGKHAGMVNDKIRYEFPSPILN